MKTLPININNFGFVKREVEKGKFVRNRCGRDFLYYALHYYLPSRFNENINSPLDIERRKIFGMRVPSSLAWLQLQFYKVPRLLKQLSLQLIINDRVINSFFAFIIATMPKRMVPVDSAIKKCEDAVNDGKVSGIDISLGFGGLLDHVMFVYGYDEDNLYVFDTHKVEGLEYEQLSGEKMIMKLPKSVIKKRWTGCGRVWIVEPMPSQR